MQSLSWDKVRLYKMSIKVEMQYSDAFAIIPVDQKYVNDVNFVAGVMPTLYRFIV